MNGSLVYVIDDNNINSIIICNKSDYTKSIELKINPQLFIFCLLVYDENIIIASVRSRLAHHNKYCYINLWNVNKQECYKTFKVENQITSLVNLSDNRFASLHCDMTGNLLASDKIMIWSINSDICIKTLTEFGRANILRSINGNLLHVSRVHKINIWNTNYKLNLILEIPRSIPINLKS